MSNELENDLPNQTVLMSKNKVKFLEDSNWFFGLFLIINNGATTWWLLGFFFLEENVNFISLIYIEVNSNSTDDMNVVWSRFRIRYAWE